MTKPILIELDGTKYLREDEVYNVIEKIMDPEDAVNITNLFEIYFYKLTPHKIGGKKNE